MQVILCGDFFQLPPIGLGGKVHFCFESDTWRQLFQGGGLVVLDTVFRQKDDVTFLNILNEMRVGALSRNSVAILNAKSKESGRIVVSTTALSNEICPTKLFSTNKDVDGFNETELSRLTSVSYIYNAVDEGSSVQVLMLKECTKAPQRLELKVGAQVMLLKNISTAKGLVNGACGTVVAIDERRDVSSYFPHLPTVRFITQVGSERMEETILISHETWDIQQGDE
jgi:ATP-dependent DNA helicase PIF1